MTAVEGAIRLRRQELGLALPHVLPAEMSDESKHWAGLSPSAVDAYQAPS